MVIVNVGSDISIDFVGGTSNAVAAIVPAGSGGATTTVAVSHFAIPTVMNRFSL